MVASNNLAVSFALGALDTKAIFWRIVFIFGLVETIVPLIGMLIGQQFAALIHNYVNNVASGLLMALGLYIVISAFLSSTDTEKLTKRITSWTGLVLLAFGLSIDNLIVGFSFGIEKENPFLIAIVIGGMSFLFISFGIKTGRYLQEKQHKIVEISAGSLIIILAILTFYDIV